MTQLRMISTSVPDHLRQSGEEAVSVIHAPESFRNWVLTYRTHALACRLLIGETARLTKETGL